jgi:hypothetical protein
VANVHHQAIGLGFAGLFVGEVDKRGKVSHWLDATFVRKVVRPNDEAMERFGDESEAVLWIDSAEVRATMQSWSFLVTLGSCADLGLLIVSICRNLLDILWYFLKTKAFHSSVLSLCLITAHQVRIQRLGILIIQSTRNEELIMEKRQMLNLIFKLHENTILQILCLQEGLSVNWAIEKALETQVPHQVLNVFFAEEIFIEIVCEIIHDIHKVFFLTSCLFFSIEAGKGPMEHAEILMINSNDLWKYFRILFLKDRSLKLRISNGFGFFFSGFTLTIYVIWVLKHNIQPNIGFNLFGQMCIIQSRYAFNWVLIVSEGLEETDDTFGDTSLLPSFVNVRGQWIEE